ncbi:MAG: right-handed parallel beta-helix repeat-containing protein [Candidatus Eisenbacteria bacterium]
MQFARVSLMVSLLVLLAAQMAGAVYVEVYSEDFDSDPGYATQDSAYVYWDGVGGNYYAKSFDVSTGLGYYMAYSPGFPLVDAAKDFRVQLDFMIVTPDEGCYPGITFQNTLVPDTNPLMPDGNTFSFRANYQWDGQTVRKLRLRSDAGELHTPSEPTAGEWYTFKIQYHAVAQTVDWVIEDDLGVVWYEGYDLAFPVAADFNRLYIGEITEPPQYGDQSDIRLDNISVSALVSPYTVDCAGGGDFLDIQDAIDVASEGDTVLVAPCTYTGPGNRDLDFGGTNIVLMSLAGADSTIIDCESAGRGFVVHSGEDSTCVIEGLTIANGTGAEGGAMWIYGEPQSSPAVRECRFVDNSAASHGGALYVDGGSDGGHARPVFTGCLFDGNSASLGGGAYLTWYSDVTFAGCTFRGNTGNGAGAYLWKCHATFEGCVFDGNAAPMVNGHGGGLFCRDALSAPDVLSCTFVGNIAEHGAGVYCDNGSSPDVADCLFWANEAVEGSALSSSTSSTPSLTNVTVVGNTAAVGTVHCGQTTSVTLNNTIIALNDGLAVSCTNGGVAAIGCSDLYGNTGGDWVGDISSQYGVSGNIADDPLFCDAEGGVFTVSADSPCAPWGNSGCGQIGAFGVGCESEVPVITFVTDVGNDQGRQARLHWLRSSHDAPGQPFAIDAYGIYRRHDAYRCSGDDSHMLDVVPPGDLRGGRLDGWDFLQTVPARGDSAYQCIAPTLCDSTESADVCWSVFMVSAMTPETFVYFDSRPDSGYSIDNLAPEAPRGLEAQYVVGDKVTLTWVESEEPDFDFYTIYGSASESGTGTPLGYSVEASFEHACPSEDYWYWVTGTDLNDNEGEASDVVSVTQTGVVGASSILSFGPAAPNPFGLETSIAYSLPEPAAVTLKVYDVTGRLVRNLLVDARKEAGRHAVAWDGRDGRGGMVASGVYFCRLEAEAEVLTEKVMLVR